MKVKIRKSSLTEQELELPFYYFCQDDGGATYIKITEEKYCEIEVFEFGETTIFSCDFNGIISSNILDYKSTKEVWEDGLEFLKEKLNKF